MSIRIPSVAKVFIALTAVGFLLSGCHSYHRAYHGGPYVAPPSYGYGHHYKGKKHGERHRHYRHGRRGWR